MEELDHVRLALRSLLNSGLCRDAFFEGTNTKDEPRGAEGGELLGGFEAQPDVGPCYEDSLVGIGGCRVAFLNAAIPATLVLE
jgi:hypothetical protein